MAEIYLKLLDDDIWQRTIRMPDARLDRQPCDPLNELIDLTETNLSFLSKAMKELQAEVRPLMLAPRRVETERFIAFRNRVNQLCQQLQKKNTILGYLAEAFMDEHEAFYILENYLDRYYMQENGQPEIIDKECDEKYYVDAVDVLAAMKRAAALPGNILKTLMATEIFFDDAAHPHFMPSPLCHPSEFSHLFCGQMFVNRHYSHVIQQQYSFHTPFDYYHFLMILAGPDAPSVSRCAYCGKLFVPSSGNNTKYCDRVQPNGKRCKELGPSATHRKNARQDPVLETFYRVKRRMYKRMERTLESLRTPTASLELDEYFAWLDAAEETRNQYQAGEITKEDALRRLDPEAAAAKTLASVSVETTNAS